MRTTASPQPIGLYHPAYEHDACGTGFVASIDGEVSHDIVQRAVQCVCNVTHRGALSADAKTGDGAGVLTQIPHQLFTKALKSLKAGSVAPGDLGVGMCFFPQHPNAVAKAVRIVEQAVASSGVRLL